jgi:hypothetical protein
MAHFWTRNLLKRHANGRKYRGSGDWIEHASHRPACRKYQQPNQRSCLYFGRATPSHFMLCSNATWLAGFISVAGFCSYFMTVKLALVWLFSDEEWFHLHGQISLQNAGGPSTRWSKYNHEVPLHSLKVCVRCAMNAKRNIGSTVYEEIINCDRCVRLTLQSFRTANGEVAIVRNFFRLFIAATHVTNGSHKSNALFNSTSNNINTHINS